MRLLGQWFHLASSPPSPRQHAVGPSPSRGDLTCQADMLAAHGYHMLEHAYDDARKRQISRLHDRSSCRPRPFPTLRSAPDTWQGKRHHRFEVLEREYPSSDGPGCHGPHSERPRESRSCSESSQHRPHPSSRSAHGLQTVSTCNLAEHHKLVCSRSTSLWPKPPAKNLGQHVLF